MKYHKLGKLPIETINFFLEEILKRKQTNVPYQWVQFDEKLHLEFLKIFSNTELKIQKNSANTHYIQKAFYSEPGYGFRIHKDGMNCRSALNIVLSCNTSDWVRWYDEDYINKITSTPVVATFYKNFGSSRNIDIFEYENIEFTEELQVEIGDVYALDVGTYHSFKCVGSLPRIIIQTKFENFPNFETINKSLSKNSFSNLIISRT